MNSFIIAVITGAALAIAYLSLLIVPVRRLIFLHNTSFITTVSGIFVRLALIALAAYGMLHYSVNHLILMMMTFYIVVVAVLVAYKGVR